MTPNLETVVQAYAHPESIKMKNPEKVAQMIHEMIRGGPDVLQVISDFDMTLTRYRKDGKICDTCHGAIRNSPTMPEKFRERADALFKKYYPVELDQRLSIPEKIPYMIKWYHESHENLTLFPISKQDVKQIVEGSRIYMRDGAKQILGQLSDKNVPVLIISAGVGDILEEALRKFGCDHDNITVVANFLNFSEDDRLTGYREPLIHMYNKTANVVKESQPIYFDQVASRKNVLLLGDSLGDVDMVDGVANPNLVLKIGFLNANVQERLASFLDAFDIVILDDQSMTFVEALLRDIL